MTDRAGLRGKCIEAMKDAVNKHKRGHGTSSETMAVAFDAIHGIARVVPPVAAKEMLLAASEFDENSQQVCCTVFHKMAAAGDLTNPQVDKS